MYYLYILYSVSADRYHIGVTNDVADRLRRHNSRHKKGIPRGCLITKIEGKGIRICILQTSHKFHYGHPGLYSFY
ncbi:GIY-YIG nuclease family protein [Sphingobacterium spiritivorum]|uniref:GIY-YIG nuclease family protein n=1 Tax=Sphingobacterium spiritivorum TaxID=258 RepID=UPI00191B20B4|nr:GIY-YIG nuclease family protein [Sphingobacterium spiritivorum]